MFSFDAWGNRRDPNDWTMPLAEGYPILFDRGFTGHEHLDAFELINMNGRVYDPRVGRFLSPDNYVQMPDFTQNFNRYTYCLNNPLKYTDPSGELFGIDDAIIFGSIALFSYLGGTAANNGQFNPIKWDWQSGNTWAGIGIGAAAGAFGGWAFATTGQALAGTAFFSHFGASGAVAAFGLAGAASYGAAGYATGFGTGMVVSHGDWDYANSLGGFYAGIGSAIGSIAGTIYGLTPEAKQYLKCPPPVPYKMGPRKTLSHSSSSTQLYSGGSKATINSLPSDQSLHFNGTALEWRQNYYDGSYTVAGSWQAWSGGRNPLPANMTNGRIPNGNWDLININWNQGGSSYKRDGVKFFGDLVARFTINGRGGFEIHPDGGPFGTNGCIGLQVDKAGLISFYNRANWYISSFGPIRVNVNY